MYRTAHTSDYSKKMDIPAIILMNWMLVLVLLDCGDG